MTSESIPQQRLRVVFCHYASDVLYGSDLSLFDLVTTLPTERFESTVVLKPGDPMDQKYRARGISVYTVPVTPPRRSKNVGQFARFLLGFLPAVWRIARIIGKVDADVVHVNTSFNLHGAVAAKFAHRPLVWHVREIAANTTFDRLVQKAVCLLANRVIAISNAVADSLRACAERVTVVMDGLDLSPYDALPDQRAARSELGLPYDVPIIITIGRLEHWKGQHVLINAMPQITKSLPDALLLIVGGPATNKPEYAASLEASCAVSGLAEQIRFLGVRNDVPALLAAADLLVLPSVEPEPLGRTVIEAMAAQLPVVATAGGGPSQTVVPDRTGYLVPAANPDALATAVLRILRSPDQGRAFGALGRERALDIASLGKFSSKMQALLSHATRTPDPGAGQNRI